MAQVPFTGLGDQPTSPGTIIPDDYQRINSSPDDFGAQIGAAETGDARDLQQVSAAVDQIQSRYDQAASSQAFISLDQGLNKLGHGDPNDPNSKGFFGQTGGDAMKAYGPTLDQAEQLRQQVRASLTTPAAQRQFDQDSRRLVMNFSAQAGDYRTRQQGVYQGQVADATIASDKSSALVDPFNDQNFLSRGGDLQNAVIAKGKLLGWAPEVTQQQIVSSTSDLYRSRAEAMAIQDPSQAWSFYQQNIGRFTGQDSFAFEHHIDPLMLAQGSKVAGAGIMGGGTAQTVSGGQVTGPVPAAIVSDAQGQNVSPGLALTSAKIESNFGQLPDRAGADPQGMYQMTGATWAARGGTAANRGDIPTQIHLGIANLAHSQQVAQQALGAPPADWQTYLVHQQGDGGGAALLTADPNTSAVAALTPAYQGDAGRAQKAVVNNGGTANMTAGQFLNLWQTRYAHLEVNPAAVTASVPAPAPAGARTVSLGDSIAQGNATNNGYENHGVQGIGPAAVLSNITALPDGYLQGRPADISSGMSNTSPDQRQAALALVQQEIDAAKAKGASDIRLFGVGDAKYPGVNAALAAIASKSGVAFTPLQNVGPDGTHPTGAGYKALARGAPPPGSNVIPFPSSTSAPPAGVSALPAPGIVGVPPAPAVPVPADGGYAPGPGVARPPTPTPDSPHDTPRNGPVAAPAPAAPADGSGPPAPATAPPGAVTTPPPAAAAPAQGTPPTSTDPRDHVAAWLNQADHVLDYRGRSNPAYQQQVGSYIRSRVAELEYGQAQTERANRDTLLSAAMGLPAGGGAATPAAGLPAPDGSSPIPASSGGATPGTGSIPQTGAKPTSLDQLLITPALRQAWSTSTPEMQRGILGMLEQNAKGADPPENNASLSAYYKLRGMAADSPGDFKSTNLADPATLALMPHHLLLDLMNRQASISTNDAKAAQAGINILHAQTVTLPDARQAGLNPQSKPGTPAADAWSQYTGRLDDALQQFQTDNKRRPNDDETKKLGQSLLTQGWLHGTGSLWGSLPNDTSTRLYQAQSAGRTNQFYPAIPPIDRAAIVSSFTSRMGRAPTQGEVEQTFMLGRQPQARPGQARPPAAPQSQPGSPGAPSASSPGRVVAPTGATPPLASPAAAPMPMAQRDADPADAAVGGF